MSGDKLNQKSTVDVEVYTGEKGKLEGAILFYYDETLEATKQINIGFDKPGKPAEFIEISYSENGVREVSSYKMDEVLAMDMLGKSISDTKFLGDVMVYGQDAENNLNYAKPNPEERLDILAKIGLATSGEVAEIRKLQNLSESPEFKEAVLGVVLPKISDWGNQLKDGAHDVSTIGGLTQMLREGRNMADLEQDNHFGKLAEEYNSRDANLNPVLSR